MLWPFKKKDDKSLESTLNKISEYNNLRISVGMQPTRSDDCAEGVAFVVVFELFSEEVAAECKTLPVGEHEIFMNTYASYLKWLSRKCVESRFPPGSWGYIEPLIEREYCKQKWYKSEVINTIFNSMVNHPSVWELKGRHSNSSSGPWTGAVMATNLAGYDLSYSMNPKFLIYVIVTSNKILETISKMSPVK